MKIDPPDVYDSRTPEQNVMAIKGWASDLAYRLTQAMTEMESEVEALRKEIETLKEEI